MKSLTAQVAGISTDSARKQAAIDQLTERLHKEDGVLANRSRDLRDTRAQLGRLDPYCKTELARLANRTREAALRSTGFSALILLRANLCRPVQKVPGSGRGRTLLSWSPCLGCRCEESTTRTRRRLFVVVMTFSLQCSIICNYNYRC